MSHDNASRRSYARPGNDLAAAREPPPSMREGISASSCALRDKQQWSGVPATVPRRRAGAGVWAVPGSNGRPPACKAQARAAICCRLALRPLVEPCRAVGCCALLRFVASTALPHACSCFARSRSSPSPSASRAWARSRKNSTLVRAPACFPTLGLRAPDRLRLRPWSAARRLGRGRRACTAAARRRSR